MPTRILALASEPVSGEASNLPGRWDRAVHARVQRAELAGGGRG